ncbi:protein DpdD [Dictyobacter kobayashii]|uniref:protein DpdD n=1 Tax=Dictyobacter kobayashii TaxID=2014872 RepID=UPI001386C315|nr:protein DpdD [Dictyobacter kobayashii]
MGLKAYPHTLEIEVQNQVIGRLLQRICDNRAVIFPYATKNQHLWLIAGPTQHELELTITRLGRFLVPSYATFNSENNQPQFKYFDATKNELQRLGALLYPAGYYSMQAPSRHLDIILSQLDLWMDLEKEQPTLVTNSTPTYYSLQERFQTAIAATDWQEAEKIIHELQRMHMITADNVAFLQIQLLAQQQRWPEIWQRPDFASLARIRMPKAVRAALLTAFYTSTLLPLEREGGWDQALATFQQNRAKLGLLLTGRFGLTQPPIIHVFAYQAALDKDLDNLRQLATVTDSTIVHDFIQRLQQIVAPAIQVETQTSQQSQEQEDSAFSLQYKIQKALFQQNYDEAEQLVRQLDEGPEKSLILMQIAFYSSDISLANEALITYWDLPSSVQQQLESRYLFLHSYIQHLKVLTQYETTPEETNATHLQPDHINSWVEWFDYVESFSSDQITISTSLNRLLANKDTSSWTKETITQVGEKLFTYLDSSTSNASQHLRDVLLYFVEAFLADNDFPRIEGYYTDIYLILYIGIIENLHINQTYGLAILRLAEAILMQDPQKCEEVFHELYEWCEQPIPALEDWVLETFDLFAEYGLPPGLLINWYRDWLSTILNTPRNQERNKLQTWQQFGRWIQPGQDLISRLDQAIIKVVEEDTRDTIAELPAGYRIGILTLRESSAQRVKEMLLERNKGLDIRICIEKDFSEQVKAIAQKSDMVVVVTTCLKHAITYGIAPYLKGDLVYPISSGSSSILAAIEQRSKG